MTGCYRIELVRHVDHVNEQLVSAHVMRGDYQLLHVTEEGVSATLHEVRLRVAALRSSGKLSMFDTK